VHGSDGPESAAREIGIFFPSSELVARLVLASRSPQRRAILDALGVAFVVRPSGFEERELGEARTVALHNALGKASAVARGAGEVVLGVDTVVSLAGRLYGKPEDPAQARATLRALSGETHTVLSALALEGLAEAPRTATCETEVSFRELDEETIECTCAAANGAIAPAATRSRGPAARSSPRSPASGRTWSACRLAPC